MNAKEKTTKILEIAEIASQLGWCLALPVESETNHIVIGEPEIVRLICAQIETENYELMEKAIFQ